MSYLIFLLVIVVQIIALFLIIRYAVAAGIRDALRDPRTSDSVANIRRQMTSARGEPGGGSTGTA